MLSFRNSSLRRKQTLIIMPTSSVALLLACVSFVANDLAGFRREMVASTPSLADLTLNTLSRPAISEIPTGGNPCNP